jgi:SAM-dependent methyltransferase
MYRLRRDPTMSRQTSRDARVYDRLWADVPQDAPSSTLIELVDRHLAGGRSDLPGLVDLGCGIGRNALYAARRGVPTIAIDHSLRAVDTLRSAGRSLPIDVIHGDFVEWLEGRDQASARAVLCFDAIHHTSESAAEVTKILRQMARVAGQGGFVLVTLLCDVAFSTGELPAGRLRVSAAEGRTLLDATFAEADCVVARRKPVRLSNVYSVNAAENVIVKGDYSAVRELRLFRL